MPDTPTWHPRRDAVRQAPRRCAARNPLAVEDDAPPHAADERRWPSLVAQKKRRRAAHLARHYREQERMSIAQIARRLERSPGHDPRLSIDPDVTRTDRERDG
jgi:hypothetical protein